MQLKPPFRWCGSKRRFAKRIVEHFPSEIHSYSEPFVGGGSVLIELINQERLVQGATIWLNDQGPVKAFWEVMTGPAEDFDDLLVSLEHWVGAPVQAYYHEWVSEINMVLDIDDYVCRFLLLNQTSFSGMWRVNAKGEFNVSRDPSKTVIRDITPQLRALRAALAEFNVVVDDCDLFEGGIYGADVIYCDPPYVETFSSYGKDKFTLDNHRFLDETLRTCASEACGSKVFLSNSDCLKTFEVYHPAAWTVLERYGRANSISSDAKTRKQQRGEVLLGLG